MPDINYLTAKRARDMRLAMTKPERLLWSVVRRKKCGPRFRRQHAVGPYILDFYCHEARLCVEVDGGSQDLMTEHDRRRDEWLAQRGIRTVRIVAQDVLTNLDGVERFLRELVGETTPSVG